MYLSKHISNAKWQVFLYRKQSTVVIHQPFQTLAAYWELCVLIDQSHSVWQCQSKQTNVSKTIQITCNRRNITAVTISQVHGTMYTAGINK